MRETTCRCGTPTRDEAYVCEGCLSELARALGEVPWTCEQLDISMQKARGVDYTTMGGSAGSETPLAVSYPAYEALTQLRHVLVTWVRFCDEKEIRHQSTSRDLPADTLVSMSRWLMWRIDGLGLNELGSDAVSEIARAVGRGRQVVDRPAEKVYAGPCECGRDVYAKPDAKLTKCDGCGAEYDVEAAKEWLWEQTDGLLVTALDGSTYLGLLKLATAQGTIDKWHQRKRIIDRGKNQDGRWLYLMSDLIGLAAQHAMKSA